MPWFLAWFARLAWLGRGGSAPCARCMNEAHTGTFPRPADKDTDPPACTGSLWLRRDGGVQTTPNINLRRGQMKQDRLSAPAVCSPDWS